MLVLESYILPNERILRTKPEADVADLEEGLFDLTASAYPYVPSHDPLGNGMGPPPGYQQIDLNFRPWMGEGSSSHPFYRSQSPVTLLDGGVVRPFHRIWPDEVRARYLAASARIG